MMGLQYFVINDNCAMRIVQGVECSLKFSKFQTIILLPCLVNMSLELLNLFWLKALSKLLSKILMSLSNCNVNIFRLENVFVLQNIRF